MKRIFSQKILFRLSLAFGLLYGLFWLSTHTNLNFSRRVGEPLDSLHGVVVYYNGGVQHAGPRNTTPDGYNLGLPYQCVEFVKRYYWQHYQHKMPDSYGHGKDFFDASLNDGETNAQRGLVQYSNPSIEKPRVGDILVFGPIFWNRYGHVAIVAEVEDQSMELIQQNPGPFGKTRRIIPLELTPEKDWLAMDDHLLGWLHKK